MLVCYYLSAAVSAGFSVVTFSSILEGLRAELLVFLLQINPEKSLDQNTKPKNKKGSKTNKTP